MMGTWCSGTSHSMKSMACCSVLATTCMFASRVLVVASFNKYSGWWWRDMFALYPSLLESAFTLFTRYGCKCRQPTSQQEYKNHRKKLTEWALVWLGTLHWPRQTRHFKDNRPAWLRHGGWATGVYLRLRCTSNHRAQCAVLPPMKKTKEAGTSETPRSPIAHAALWVVVGASFLREALHLVLPADAALGFGTELFLATVPAVYVYERRNTPGSIGSALVAGVALLTGALALGFQQLMFPAAEARFWLTPPLVLLASVVGQSIVYQTGLFHTPSA